MTHITESTQDEIWQDILAAVDKAYTELVDYQERLEAQNQELNELRQFMSSVMASISDYLLVVGRNGTITEAGQSMCVVLGADIVELKTRTVSQIFRTKSMDSINDTLAHVISTRQKVTIDAELIVGGDTEPVELRLSPHLDRRKKVIGVVLAARPLGELKRAYTDLAASHNQLKQAQAQLVRNEKLASLGRLLAGVAHELNNPISFVYANTHAMDKYTDRFETYFDAVKSEASRDELIALRGHLKLDREIRNLRLAIDGARDGAERVRDLVSDLRRLAADGSGEFEQFDLVQATRDAATWIQRGAKQDISISYSGLVPCYAMGRLNHIQQVLLNLIQNAVDAIEDGLNAKISFHFEYSGDYAILTIQDNGIGIAESDLHNIFDPFFTTKEVGQGTGLGLSISHKIVQEHGGDLRHCPNSMSGTTFQMCLKSGETE